MNCMNCLQRYRWNGDTVARTMKDNLAAFIKKLCVGESCMWEELKIIQMSGMKFVGIAIILVFAMDLFDR